MKIFESVPNISEGRNSEIIEKLINAVLNVPDIRVLDYSSDVDHNRSVFTFIGTEQALIEANFRLVKMAAELLNIQEHSGVHPRLGVVDVIPIIPVCNATMADAVAVSTALGEKIKNSLAIPILYYEYSAQDESDRNLANVRRKSYNRGIGHDKAGAICVGARDYLVAYNINLETKDVQIAKKIAAIVRHSSGGLPGVKALGLYLTSKECAQVSMNLTAPVLTDPKKAYESIAELAKGVGVKIKEEELIGVLPAMVVREAQKLSEEIDERIELLKKSHTKVITEESNDAQNKNS